MGSDDTLTSHIELVADEFDMACQRVHLKPISHENEYHMHFLPQNSLKCEFCYKTKCVRNICKKTCNAMKNVLHYSKVL